MSNPRPLEDITVLDLTTALAGPYATFLLAGLGARVIKIENPTGPDTCRANAPYLGPDGPHLTRQHPDDISVSAINRLRNKQAVTLNYEAPGLPSHFREARPEGGHARRKLQPGCARPSRRRLR